MSRNGRIVPPIVMTVLTALIGAVYALRRRAAGSTAAWREVRRAGLNLLVLAPISPGIPFLTGPAALAMAMRKWATGARHSSQVEAARI